MNSKGFLQKATESLSRALGSPSPEEKKDERPSKERPGRRDSLHEKSSVFSSSSRHRTKHRDGRESKSRKPRETAKDTAARLYDDWSRQDGSREYGQLKEKTSRSKHRHHNDRHKASKHTSKSKKDTKTESPHPTDLSREAIAKVHMSKLKAGPSKTPKSPVQVTPNKPVIVAMRSTTAVRPASPGAAKRTCSICADENIDPNSKFGSLILECCGNTTSVCQDCFSHWIDSSLGDGKKGVAIKCAEDGCNDVLGYWDIVDLVNTETREKFEKMVFTGVLSDMDEFVRCPLKNCGSGQLHAEHKTNPRMICHNCNKASCIKHAVPWHENQTCDEYDKRKNTNDPKRAQEELASLKEIAATSKPCPGCKAPIQRTDGCDHMTCRVCKGQFCWICLALDEDRPGSHERNMWRWHYRNCPDYDTAYSKVPTKPQADANKATELRHIPDVGRGGRINPRHPDGAMNNNNFNNAEAAYDANRNVNVINNVGFNYQYQPNPHQQRPAAMPLRQYGGHRFQTVEPQPQYQPVNPYQPNIRYQIQAVPANFPPNLPPAVVDAVMVWSQLPDMVNFRFTQLPMPHNPHQGIMVAQAIYWQQGRREVPAEVIRMMFRDVYGIGGF